MLLTPLINSYRFNERHSLWYLLPVIQTTDPALFAADPVVASIALFRSVFYDGLSYLVSILEISPSNLPLFLKALSIIVQAGIVGLLFAISRRLSPNLWVFTFLAAWACQQRSAIIGGDQTFTSTLTHREVAELLGLAAVYLMLCGRALQASLVLSFTVFIHVLVAIHLFVAMVPAIVFVKRRVTWPMALGVAVFAACALCYALILAPPRMDAAAQQIFLQAKADIAHVSLFAQSWLQWVEMIGLAGLVFGVWRLVGPKDDNIRLLEAFAITAAAFGIVTAILFHATSSVSVAQLQSLRSFTWVMLFTVTLLVLATSKALSTAGPTAAVLLGVLAFEILGGVLRFAFLGLGWILLAGASTRVRSMVSLERTQRFVTQSNPGRLRRRGGRLACGRIFALRVAAQWVDRCRRWRARSACRSKPATDEAEIYHSVSGARRCDYRGSGAGSGTNQCGAALCRMAVGYDVDGGPYGKIRHVSDASGCVRL